ncbi:P-loop containing nucleoside triphosphate hydrolase protein [Choiromyces venosus 120613-1]|uniref:P-loop containing nucleoside triphosphate hydrolase protein n=1 Tax=Choiromyces venosus 120613-1 TaxID=1336337 RepID=A0A3N4KEF8_9PEZI|nr:P-loop containing nucleoside triphosphate hydrolase protein [Choiromyces venosus 120613-1]
MIAVMGKTGTGKTSFVNALTGNNDLTVGHGLEACTQDVQTAKTTISGREVWLIDTPGFDDTHRSDVDILSTIATWVQAASSQSNQLTGIIYFHRITDTRMEGSNMKNLRMFRELCGEKNFSNVILLTTMWGKVDEEEGKRREQELQSRTTFWGRLCAGGAQVRQHRGPDLTASARKIAEELMKKDKITLQLQDELSQYGSLSDTSAGRMVEGAILQMKKKHEEEMEAIKAEMQANNDKNEIELLKQYYQHEIEGLKKTTEQMEKLRAEDARQFQNRIQQMQHDWDNRPHQGGGGCILS